MFPQFFSGEVCLVRTETARPKLFRRDVTVTLLALVFHV